jgi:hypothetical protein
LYVALLPFGLVRAAAAFRALAATLRPPTVLGCPAPATYHDGKSMS